MLGESWDGDLLHSFTLADTGTDGWTTFSATGLSIPAGYGAIVIVWETNANLVGGAGGDLLGIDNVVIESHLP